MLLNVDSDTRAVLHAALDDRLDLEDIGGLEQLSIGLEQGRIHSDALVLGVSLDEPVRIAQRVHSLGVDMPVLILSEPGHCDQLKRALKFAPFLGNDVTPHSIADGDTLASVLADMVARARKRRRYKGSMEAAQQSLGKISAPPPQITRYFERLLDRAPIGVLNLSINGAILNLNRHACQVLGVSERDALGSSLAELFAEHERGRLQAIVARCVAPLGRGQAETLEIAGQPVRHVEIIASSLVDRSGQLGATIILQDVSARIRAEQERNKAIDNLRASESRYRELVETMNEALALTDASYRITFVNRQFCDMFAYRSEEVIGMPLINLVHDEDKEMMRRRMATAAQDGQERFETAWTTRNGEKIYTLTSPKSLFDEEQCYIGCLGVFTDITARKAVEQREKLHMLELAQMSRVTTIGEMSSQIAHELAQPLSAIGGMSSALLKFLGKGIGSSEDIEESLGEIQTQAKRAREIIMRLRNFVRNEELQRVPVELNELVSTVIRLSNVDARWKGISVELRLGQGLPQALGDRVLIEQVMLNLVRNACEAMQELEQGRRHLTIATNAVDDDNLRVSVSVSDTGPGLSEALLEQACQPFFTTKSGGMGMGLAIARSVVDAHEGRLTISNNPQGGACFSFDLPVVNDE